MHYTKQQYNNTKKSKWIFFVVAQVLLSPLIHVIFGILFQSNAYQYAVAISCHELVLFANAITTSSIFTRKQRVLPFAAPRMVSDLPSWDFLFRNRDMRAIFSCCPVNCRCCHSFKTIKSGVYHLSCRHSYLTPLIPRYKVPCMKKLRSTVMHCWLFVSFVPVRVKTTVFISGSS